MDTIIEKTPPSKGEEEGSGDSNQSVRASIRSHFIYVLGRAYKTLQQFCFVFLFLRRFSLNLSFQSILYLTKCPSPTQVGLNHESNTNASLRFLPMSQIVLSFFQVRDALANKLGLNSDSDDPEFAKK